MAEEDRRRVISLASLAEASFHRKRCNHCPKMIELTDPVIVQEVTGLYLDKGRIFFHEECVRQFVLNSEPVVEEVIKDIAENYRTTGSPFRAKQCVGVS